MILMRSYIYMKFFKILLSYYFIDLCHILNQLNSESDKFIMFIYIEY